MARRKLNPKVDTRTARAKLAQRREPYWTNLTGGLALGYRRGATGGNWIARHYSAEHGRRFQAIGAADDMLDDGAVSFDAAQAAAREWLARLVQPNVLESAGPYTVNAACDAYLAYLAQEGRSAAAVRDAGYRVNAYIRPVLGAHDANKLTADALRTWRAKLASDRPRLRTRAGEVLRHRDEANERARKASANRNLTTLKAVLNHAFDEGKVAGNSAWGRRVAPFESVEVARVRYLTVAEAQRLINASDSDFRPLVTGALQTGARYGELAALQIADFNPDAGTITVRQSKAGKARHVVLTDEGAAFFRRLCAGRAGPESIFLKERGGAWLKSHQGRPMAAACKRAEIVPAIGFHGLRHTWASHAVMNGVPLLVVARNLGHADTRMVERHYGHLAESYVTDAIRAGAPRFGTDQTNVRGLR